MLKENDKVKVHMMEVQNFPNGIEIKTRNHDMVSAVKKDPATGRLGIDWNTDENPSLCDGRKCVPFQCFSWTVLFENVETGRIWHYNQAQDCLEELENVGNRTNES